MKQKRSKTLQQNKNKFSATEATVATGFKNDRIKSEYQIFLAVKEKSEKIKRKEPQQQQQCKHHFSVTNLKFLHRDTIKRTPHSRKWVASYHQLITKNHKNKLAKKEKI